MTQQHRGRRLIKETMNKKTLLLILGIVLSLGLIAGVFFMVRQQMEPETSPTPTPAVKPTPSPSPEAQVPEVFEVGNACTSTFTVTENLVPGLSCTTKNAYRDDSRNGNGTYYLVDQITGSETLAPGEKLVYAIAYKNTGTAKVTGATVTDVLPAQLDYVDGEPACTYTASSRTVKCTIGEVVPNGAAQVAFRVQVKSSATAGNLQNEATFTPKEGTASKCSATNAIAVEAEPSVSPSPSPSGSPQPSPSDVQATLSCTKRAWKDEAGNKADQYTYITALDGAKPGDTVVYELAYTSSELNFVDVEDILDANLQFVDSADECTYTSTTRKLTCRLTDLGTRPNSSILFRARVSDAAVVGSTIANTGTFTNTDNALTKNCSKNLTVSAAEIVSSPPPSTIAEAPAEASPVPSELPEAGIMTFTTGTVGIGILLVILGLLGVLLI